MKENENKKWSTRKIMPQRCESINKHITLTIIQNEHITQWLSREQKDQVLCHVIYDKCFCNEYYYTLELSRIIVNNWKP